MFIRILFVLFLLTSCAYSIIWVAAWTNFFDGSRLKKYAKNTGIGAAALLVALTLLAVFTNIDQLT